MITDTVQIDLERTMDYADRVARYVCGHRHSFWREDVAQEVALRVWQQAQIGYPVNRQGYYWAARNALRGIVGVLKSRRSGEKAGKRLAISKTIDIDTEGLPLPSISPPDPCAVIAVCRLQREWPTMGRTQREAIGLVIDGGRGASIEAGKRLGVTTQALRWAKKAAMARLDCR